jgi:hypothetical protein
MCELIIQDVRWPLPASQIVTDRSGLRSIGRGALPWRFADVWKGNYGGQEVAVKVLRIYADSDLQKITRVSHYKRCSHFQ